MKKHSLLVLTACLLMAFSASAQCDAEKFLNHCNSKLANGFTFLKSYHIDKGKAASGKVEYSYVFSKDTNYMLTLCNKDGDPKNLAVSIYDQNRKLIYSSFDKKSNTFYPFIGYRASSTGIYYLTFTFEGDGPECGGSVLGFKR